MKILSPTRTPSSYLYVRALAGAHAARLRRARQRKDAGASVIELAIITAIIVGLAIALLAVITTVVTNRQGQISNGG